MKYSLISVMEYRFGIFSPSAPEKIKREKFDFEPLLLSPSENFDFEIWRGGGSDSEEFYLTSLISALSFYFFNVCGFPSQEIDLTDTVSNFTIKNTGKTLFKNTNCKEKFTKRTAEISGVGLEYGVFRKNVVIIAEKLENFAEESFNSILLKEKSLCSAAVAFSLNGGCVSVKKRGDVKMLESAVLISNYLISKQIFKLGDALSFSFDSGQKLKLKYLNASFFEIEMQSEFLGSYEYF